jgi:hypothetical protein
LKLIELFIFGKAVSRHANEVLEDLHQGRYVLAAEDRDKEIVLIAARVHLPALPVGLISVQVLPLDIRLALDDEVVHPAATTSIPYLVLFLNLLNCEILSELLEVPSHVWHLR